MQVVCGNKSKKSTVTLGDGSLHPGPSSQKERLVKARGPPNTLQVVLRPQGSPDIPTPFLPEDAASEGLRVMTP